MSLTRLRSLTAVCFMAFSTSALAADRVVFSGPQIGETLAPFEVFAVDGDREKIDPIKMAAGKPTLMVFVHKLTRPGVALARTLTSYAQAQSKNGAMGAIVWLDDDTVKAKEYLVRAKKSLNFRGPVGVSVDGVEGPGVYGLNRNVELTILVAKENKVTANFAITQPSVTEAAKIASELAKLIDQPAPSQNEMEKLAYPGQMAMQKQRNAKPNANGNGELRTMMKTLIGTNTDEDGFNEARRAIEKWVGDKQPRKRALHQMANAVMQRGMGSKKAQELLKHWIEKYSPKADSKDGGKPADDAAESTKRKAQRDGNP